VKLQRVIAASALLCGRTEARLSDFWVVRHIWDTEEQQEILASLVDQAINKESAAAGDHPRARSNDGPDTESLARDLEGIGTALKTAGLPEVERAYLRDRLGVLEGRCQWVKDAQKRDWLSERVAELWPALREKKAA
jgi:MoxR-like ATPase